MALSGGSLFSRMIRIVRLTQLPQKGRRNMADIRLLKLIDSLSDDRGFANHKAVEQAYGQGCTRAVNEASDDGHLAPWRETPMGSIKLSSRGRELARG